jgi:hypothetical protein
MSAYVVSSAHIDLLISAALYLDPMEHGMLYAAAAHRLTSSNASETGRMLLRENIASVSYRYPDCPPDALPGPVPTPDPETYDVRFWPLASLEPVAVLKAIHAYAYQSSEHPGWLTSQAKAFCDALTVKAICQLPGYEDAAWSIAA